MANVYEKLMGVQSQLKAPKSQKNTFGNYNYRSCEDILEAVKPLLLENKSILNITDEIVQVGERFYVKATAIFIDIEKGDKIEVSALAREDENKKGMDLAQITGSVSSYARKYALNGLFCIDDTKDSDSMNKHDKEGHNNIIEGILNEKQVARLYAIAKSAGFDAIKVKKHLLSKYKISSTTELTKVQYDEMCKGYEKLKK